MSEVSPDETVRAAIRISHARLRKQHELVVDFGVKSLKESNLDRLLSLACKVAASGMETQFAKVLLPSNKDGQFRLAYGVGWNESDIGSASVGGDDASPAGYAFMTNRPVISNHLGEELRFRTPSLLKRYGIHRAINVPIRGKSKPFGILEVDSSDEDDFIESDLVFLEGIANVVSMAVERVMAATDEQDPAPYSESVLNASPDCIKILSPQGDIVFLNHAGLCQLRIAKPADVLGHFWGDLWPEESRETIEDAIVRVASGDSVRFESFCPTTLGEPRWWDVSVAPVFDTYGTVENIIAVSRDVTERHDQEAQLAELIEVQNTKINENDLHLDEIHHRVRNSLQLVNTLLLLQANVATEEAVKLQLQTAANRVLTIARVHDRLYQTSGTDTTSAPAYLRALLEDIGKAFGDRRIDLEADEVSFRPERLAPMGLVVSELVTNSFKYGKGTITVALKREADHCLIVVTDEGNGFPNSYPKPSGSGLGMRLVKSYSGFGQQAVTVSPATTMSMISVKFKP